MSMLAPPRCPACRAWLSTDRVISEEWQDGEVTPGWTYRYACGGCLSVVRRFVPQPRDPRRERPDPAEVDIAGALAARARERLDAADGPSTLRGEMERLRADPVARILLRVPEVFRATRRAFEGRVRILEDVCFVAPLAGGHGDPPVTPELRRWMPDGSPAALASVLARDSGMIVLTAGLVVGVHGFGETHVLLTPPAAPGFDPAGHPVAALAAWGDLVEPAGERI